MTKPQPWKRWLSDWFASWRADTGTDTDGSDADVDATSQQRQRRNARRESLYSIVRETMIRVGVLSSAYKFKVLTLDPDGISHLILVEIQAAAIKPVAGGQSALERELQQTSRDQAQLRVVSVYWRLLDDNPVTNSGGFSSAPRTPSEHDEISQDEIVALRQALAGKASAGHLSPADFGPTLPMGQRNGQTDHPLSETQLGDLR